MKFFLNSCFRIHPKYITSMGLNIVQIEPAIEKYTFIIIGLIKKSDVETLKLLKNKY